MRDAPQCGIEAGDGARSCQTAQAVLRAADITIDHAHARRAADLARMSAGSRRAVSRALRIPEAFDWRVLGIAGLVLAANAEMLLLCRPHAGEVAVLLAIFAAATISSVAGFAFSAICGAMLFHMIPSHVRVVEIMVVCSIANQFLMIWSMRSDIAWRALAPFLAGGLLGLPGGVFLLLATRSDVYAAGFGALLVVYVTWRLFHPRLTVPPRSPLWDGLVGVAGGFTGGAAAFPGAAVTVWCGLKGWGKNRQRALYQPFILIMQIAALLAIALSQPAAPHAMALLATDWLFVPASLLGTWCGMTLFRMLNDRQFANVVNALLLGSGLGLIL